jgi:hypothetical protein
MRLAAKQKRVLDWKKTLLGDFDSSKLKSEFQEKLSRYEAALKEAWEKNEESQELISLERELDSLQEQVLLVAKRI